MEKKRNIEWKWVKGHSGENGNWWADKLADEGKRGEIGKHNQRWAAPPPPAARKEQWKNERCRKCGEKFGLDGRRCAMHETACGGTGVEGLGYPGYMKCRRCAKMLGSGDENPRLLMQTRRRHENVCLGSDLANKTCRGCGEIFDGEDPMATRKRHEMKCKEFKELGITDGGTWKCKCGYVAQGNSVGRARQVHEEKCTGNRTKNRTCQKCGYVEDDRYEFVQWGHMRQCPGPRGRRTG